MGKNNLALFYEYEWYVFSNFSSFQVFIFDEVWPTAEHAYHGAKFKDLEIKKEILNTRSAHEAYKLSHKYQSEVREDWDEVKLDFMERILRVKLVQHPYVKKKLLQTGKLIIMEDSHRDSYWGRGEDWKGKNHLGKLWMKLREELFDDIGKGER